MWGAVSRLVTSDLGPIASLVIQAATHAQELPITNVLLAQIARIFLPSTAGWYAHLLLSPTLPLINVMSVMVVAPSASDLLSIIALVAYQEWFYSILHAPSTAQLAILSINGASVSKNGWQEY